MSGSHLTATFADPRPRAAEAPPSHWYGAPVRIPRHAAGEVDAHRLPIEPGTIEIERDFVGVARGSDAVEPIVRHLARFPIAATRRHPASCPNGTQRSRSA